VGDDHGSAYDAVDFVDSMRHPVAVRLESRRPRVSLWFSTITVGVSSRRYREFVVVVEDPFEYFLQRVGLTPGRTNSRCSKRQLAVLETPTRGARNASSRTAPSRATESAG
jgi:hypothetical protein